MMGLGARIWVTIGGGLVLALIGAEASAAPPVSMLSLPKSGNLCLKVTPLSDALTLQSSCDSVRVIRCVFGMRQRASAWKCDIAMIGNAAVRWNVAEADASGPQIYLGVCRPNVKECKARQDYLVAEVDQRQDKNLEIDSLAPPRTEPTSCDVTTLNGTCVRRRERG